MRKFKFRAWQKYHHDMLEVLSIEFRNNLINSIVVKYPTRTIPNIINYSTTSEDFYLYECEEPVLELMQYIGLKDRNGKDVYEGDILEIGGTYYAIEYSEVNGMYTLVDVHGVNYGAVCEFAISRMEIVGNLYENPELLKECDSQSIHNQGNIRK